MQTVYHKITVLLLALYTDVFSIFLTIIKITLIPKSFGTINFRTKKCPKVCNTENILIFSPCPKVYNAENFWKIIFFSNFVLQALIGMKTIFLYILNKNIFSVKIPISRSSRFFYRK